MVSGDGTTNEYQPGFLQERVRASQDAYADGELIIAWLGRTICWLLAWGQCLQPRQHPPVGVSESSVKRWKVWGSRKQPMSRTSSGRLIK